MSIMGRPRKKIDIKEFEKLCGLHCTKEEIAAFFDMNMDTLESRIKEYYDGRTFSEVFKEKRDIGKISLRRSQWLLAQKNPALSIWLGKNYLNQVDSSNENKDKSVTINLSYDPNKPPEDK